jgi:hypothetical protein
MQTTSHRYALRALAAADLAAQLSDKIQDLYAQNMAIAKRQTIEQARALIQSEIAALPNFLGVEIDDDSLTNLINYLL